MQESLAKRTISSTLWQSGASLINTAVMFVRSILLARWLPVEVFGIYGYASAVVSFSSIFADFGMSNGFFNRVDETEDEEQAAASYFTLRVIFDLVWIALVLLYSSRFVDQEYRPALNLLTVIHLGIHITTTPRLLLHRRVVYRRLSLLSTVDTLVSSAVSVSLAYLAKPVWALIATDAVTFFVYVIGLYIWRPVWRPKINWSPPTMRYFLSYGTRNVLGGLLAQGIDRIDDVWTGSYLGSAAMGFYSKAYTFAAYPRRVFAGPLMQISAGSYAELKGDRQRLSMAFFRVNAALVRSSFLLGGLLVLVAPEFIRILLDSRWLPMLDAYRLMLIFTLLDPVKGTIASLFIALGEPERIVATRAVQMVVLITGLTTLGPRFGIAGVALAVDAMVLVGIVLLIWQSRIHVDFSIFRLLGVPGVGLALALLTARGAVELPGVLGSDWHTGAVKSVSFLLTYAIVLLALEGRQTLKIAEWVVETFRPQGNSTLAR